MFGDHLSPSFVNVSSSSNQAGALATVVRGAFKIAENESPRPQDRLFFTYNYFNSVPGGSDASGVTRSDVHRVVMGFEKTVLDGNISVGVRAPFIRFQGDGSVGREDLGDPSIVLKYAFINDRQTGNVLSGGLVVTAPVGASFLPAGAANIHPTLFQPYVGAIYNLGDWYVQGFSSIILPTAHRDVTAWYNDVALGYFLYRTTQPGRLLTAVVPTIELHVTTPLNHHGGDAQPITGIDLVDLTAGVTFGVGRRSTLGLAVVTPLTGPRPFAVEGQAYLNCRF